MKGEFEFIQNIKKQYSLNKIGDDCAVLPKDDKMDLVVTADMLVEDIDFRVDWTTPELLGHKALAVSLSDIAAMGAEPKWAMLSIGVPERRWKESFVDRFYAGWHKLANNFAVELVGGDISRTPDRFVVDSVVGGEVSKGRAILRSGAVVGDAIVVTGQLGGSAGGLTLLASGKRLRTNTESWEDDLMSTHLQPWPQTATGIYLQRQNLVNSLIDISDGLASDLQHMCEASAVGARLDSEAIPIDIGLRNLLQTFDEQLNMALNGGEDFQLLFTLPKERLPALVDAPDRGLFTVIGEITSNVGIIELVRNGESEILEPKGYRHF